MKLINNSRRRLGIPSRNAVVINAGGMATLPDSEFEYALRNKTVARWVESGVLTAVPDGEEVPPRVNAPATVEVEPPVMRNHPRVETKPAAELPDGLTGEGFEMYTTGGGWYDVYVNGFQVTDKKVRKDEAEAMREDY